MWDWLRRRTGRPRHSRPASVNEERAGQFPDVTPDVTRPIRPSSRPFFTPSLQMGLGSSPPKCLSQLQCSEILYGARLEDFSEDCWLEDHLHRFGLPALQQSIGLTSLHADVMTSQGTSMLFEEDEESVNGSSESFDTTTDYSQFDMDIHDTLEMARDRSGPRLALEELFVPLDEMDLSEPPPYSPFPDDPPTYEEAVGSGDRRSTGTRSSSSSLAFIW